MNLYIKILNINSMQRALARLRKAGDSRPVQHMECEAVSIERTGQRHWLCVDKAGLCCAVEVSCESTLADGEGLMVAMHALYRMRSSPVTIYPEKGIAEPMMPQMAVAKHIADYRCPLHESVSVSRSDIKRLLMSVRRRRNESFIHAQSSDGVWLLPETLKEKYGFNVVVRFGSSVCMTNWNVPSNSMQHLYHIELYGLYMISKLLPKEKCMVCFKKTRRNHILHMIIRCESDKGTTIITSMPVIQKPTHLIGCFL